MPLRGNENLKRLVLSDGLSRSFNDEDLSAFYPEAADHRGDPARHRQGEGALEALVLSFLDDAEIGLLRFGRPRLRVRLHHAWKLGDGCWSMCCCWCGCVFACGRGDSSAFYPEVNRDLLITGAILHDIGKVKELSWKRGFSYTLEGQMVGHISIWRGLRLRRTNTRTSVRPESTRMREKVRQLPDFPEKLRVLVST